jgi:PIN domain
LKDGNDPETEHQTLAKESRQPKFVVLDANVFISDYWLRSPSFLLLREFLKGGDTTLVVPKIVFEEVVNHRREDLEKLKSDLRAQAREAGRLLRSVKAMSWLLDISRADSAEPYDKFLSTELTGMKAEIPDYADIPHINIVNRDLKRKKPFQQSGKGYRDTLLWETIVRHHVATDVLTAFVTQNSRDFSGKEGILHSELIRDVNAIGGEVVLFRDLPAFTDAHIVPYLTERRDFALLVQHDKVPGLNLNDACERNMDNLVKAVDEESFLLVDDISYEPQVDNIDIPGAFEVNQASQVSKDVLLVAFQFEAFVTYTFFLPRNEFFLMSEEQQTSISILDAEWNEWVMQVESSTLLTFSCRLTFNTAGKEVESFEVDSIASAA